MASQGLNHVGFTVSNLQDSIDWYEKILDCKLLMKDKLDETKVQGIFQEQDTHAEVALLSIEGGGMVELFQFTSLQKDLLEDTRLFKPQHFAIATDDIQKRYEELQKINVKILFSPKNISGIEFFYLEDPDGNKIEYIKFNSS